MNQTKHSQFCSPTQEGKMTTKLFFILILATIFLTQYTKGQKIESNVGQGKGPSLYYLRVF